MSLSDRVSSLKAADQTVSLDKLMRSVVQNEPIRSICIDGDTVQVETVRFTGTHDLEYDSEYHRIHLSGGEYEFSSNGVVYQFTTSTSRRDVSALVKMQLNRENGFESEYPLSDDVPRPAISVRSSPVESSVNVRTA